MGVVRLHCVISFSSQDEKYQVENILNGYSDVTTSRWLTASSDKSGRLEAEFQLEKASLISYLDIGNFGSATVEVLVGRSSWPRRKEYLTFLPTVVFMTPTDCRNGKNNMTVRMFTEEHLDKVAIKEKWDRIKIICCQPYSKNLQFGLSFLRLGNNEDNIIDAASENLPDAALMDQAKTLSTETSSIRTSKPARVRSLTSDKGASRAAKMLRAAHLANSSTRKAINIKKEYSSQLNLSLEEEALLLLTSLESSKKLSFKELCHKLETKRGRRLTCEEEKKFMDIAKDFGRSKIDGEFQVIYKESLNRDKASSSNLSILSQYKMPSVSRNTLSVVDINTSPNKKLQKHSSSSASAVTSKSLTQSAGFNSSVRFYSHEKSSVTDDDYHYHLSPEVPDFDLCFDYELNECNSSLSKESSIKSDERNNSVVVVDPKHCLSPPVPDFDLSFELESVKEESDDDLTSSEYSLPSKSMKLHNYKNRKRPTLLCTRQGKERKSTCVSRRNEDDTTSQTKNFLVVQCPLCEEYFPQADVENHAAVCMEEPNRPDLSPHSSSPESFVECPVCNEIYDIQSITSHANMCADLVAS